MMSLHDYFKSFDLKKKLIRFYQNELREFDKILGIKKNTDC